MKNDSLTWDEETNNGKGWLGSLINCNACAYCWAAAYPADCEYLECPICHHMNPAPADPRIEV